MDFTIDEIRLLDEGLDAIEKAASSHDLMGELIGSLMSKDEHASERAARAMEEKRRARESQQEKVILLKAKLIQLKRIAEERAAREIVHEALG